MLTIIQRSRNLIESITWIVLCFSLIGFIFNLLKRRICFKIWLFTNSFWIIYNISLKEYALSVLFVMYFIGSIYGLYTWEERKS